MIMEQHKKLHQRIILPRLDTKGSREVFAKWKPSFDNISFKFLTDANGFEIMNRHVFSQYSDTYYSSSFYPVDSSITMGDSTERMSLTIWNDRPQAGSVAYDKSIKLLIDRRVRTSDQGGIPENMFAY